VLVRSPEIGALAFVGGRSNGGKVAASLLDTGKRHMLEQEGLNAWGIWELHRIELTTTAQERCPGCRRWRGTWPPAGPR
jgi:acyl-CoA reductase-like NAD-dependent aldehyde dehydrogenase